MHLYLFIELIGVHLSDLYQIKKISSSIYWEKLFAKDNNNSKITSLILIKQDTIYLIWKWEGIISLLCQFYQSSIIDKMLYWTYYEYYSVCLIKNRTACSSFSSTPQSHVWWNPCCSFYFSCFLSCAFVCIRVVSCAKYYLCLLIVHSWLPLRFSLTFIWYIHK